MEVEVISDQSWHHYRRRVSVGCATFVPMRGHRYCCQSDRMLLVRLSDVIVKMRLVVLSEKEITQK